MMLDHLQNTNSPLFPRFPFNQFIFIRKTETSCLGAHWRVPPSINVRPQPLNSESLLANTTVAQSSAPPPNAAGGAQLGDERASHELSEPQNGGAGRRPIPQAPPFVSLPPAGLDGSSLRRILSSHSAAGRLKHADRCSKRRGWGGGNVRKDGDGLPRMQNTRRPLPSALPVAKVKGSGSSHCLRPLRLHLPSSSLAVRPAVRQARSPKPPTAKKRAAPKPPSQRLFFTHRDTRGPSDAPPCGTAARLPQPRGRKENLGACKHKAVFYLRIWRQASLAVASS